jgi:hypothetical protein
MRRILFVLTFVGCNKGLVTAPHAPQADARRVLGNDDQTHPTRELGSNGSEPARIGPPLGNGAGSRRISARDDAPTFESSAHLAEMDSVSSIDRK